MRRASLAVAILVLAALACSSTKMVSTWKAPDFQRGSLRKILVVGVFKADGMRETVEGQFVELLKDENVEAAASNAFLPVAELQREAVVQKVRDLQYDGVLLARIVDSTLETKHYPAGDTATQVNVGYYDDWYKDYVVSTEEVAAIGHTVQSSGTARVETRLYSAKTQKSVWIALSETSIDGREVSQIRGAVGKLVDRMVTSGIF